MQEIAIIAVTAAVFIISFVIGRLVSLGNDRKLTRFYKEHGIRAEAAILHILHIPLTFGRHSLQMKVGFLDSSGSSRVGYIDTEYDLRGRYLVGDKLTVIYLNEEMPPDIKHDAIPSVLLTEKQCEFVKAGNKRMLENIAVVIAVCAVMMQFSVIAYFADGNTALTVGWIEAITAAVVFIAYMIYLSIQRSRLK